MASTFTLKSDSYQGRYLQLDCTQEKDISRNVSVIKWTLKTVGQSETYYNTGPTTAKINGKQVYYKARTSWSSEAFPAAPGSVSGTTEVSHDNTGNASIPVSLSTAIYTSSVTTKSGTWTLDTIPRQATLTAAPNFNDEQNPTITYSNPAGNAVTSLKACIANSTGSVIYAAYRDISKTGTSYTFNLTDAERTALRKAATTNTLKVKFYVTTVIGGTTFYSTQEKEMSIVNADPILAPTAKDTGGYSVPLTGDANNKVIKGFNYMNVAVNATAQKGATIVSQSITCGSQRINGGSGGFNNVESGTFVFTATDSRGNTKTIPLEKELIPYIKLTCNLDVPNPTTDGETTLKISGNYYKGSFGAENNAIVAFYKYKKNNEAYSQWIPVTVTPNTNSYSVDVPITGLDYQASYTFQAEVSDRCLTLHSPEKVVKSTPVFDWGANDFNINGALKVNNIPIESTFYPVGSTYTNSTNINPKTLFGGEWEQIKTYSGGELVAFGTVYAINGSVCANNEVIAFSDTKIGGKTTYIKNFIPNIMWFESGALKLSPQNIVGLVEATVSISGQGESGMRGIWWQHNYNALPTGVYLRGDSCLLTGPIDANYGGNTNTYYYDVDGQEAFYINPSFKPYGGNFKPSISGTISYLKVKVYAKAGTTYVWKRIS